ncbi:MAG: hypothetical protein HDT22_01765 [Ruminococcus sp.]|nr:hypothetical protein [Ruminococcus sp.]
MKDKKDEININTENKPVKSQKNIFKRIATAPLSVIKSNLKNIASKANPLDKNINKNDVSDSGIESMRFAYTNSKKAIKTVDRTIKTTQRTIRNIKTSRNVINKTGKMIYKTGKFTGKAVIFTVKVAKTIVINVTAALMNPVVIIIAIFVVILIMVLAMVVLLMGGGASANISEQYAYSSAAGLVNVPEQYQNALDFFNTAVANRQEEFNSIIDNMYYDYNNLTESSLVYMERTLPEPIVIYDKSFSIDERKATLKSAWDMDLTVTAKEAIAIAYVYLEKEKNTENHTEGGIYEVSYTQEVFDLILTKCVTFSNTVYSGQYCPDENCTRHVELVDNPYYYEVLNKVNEAATNYNNSSDEYWWNYWGQEYEYWSSVLDNTSPTIEEITYICEYQHDLHSIGLAFFTKEDIMNALEFTDNDKQWEELTEKGFENNYNIST